LKISEKHKATELNSAERRLTADFEYRFPSGRCVTQIDMRTDAEGHGWQSVQSGVLPKCQTRSGVPERVTIFWPGRPNSGFSP
jgi:hypothetical protein